MRCGRVYKEKFYLKVKAGHLIIKALPLLIYKIIKYIPLKFIAKGLLRVGAN